MTRRQIGDYAVRGELEWGERRVYVATRGQASNRYLLLVLEIDDASAIELEDEILRTMELDHDNVMRPAETFADGDQQVVAYDTAPGTTLNQLSHYLAASGEPLSDGAALEIARQMSRGLAAAHAAIDSTCGETSPLVHAELCPRQIFITWKGQVKILGLGLSAAFRQGATGRQDMLVQAYAAPEIRRGGEPTIGANVYSAAAIAWSLLTRARMTASPIRPLGEVRPDLDRTLTTAVDEALRTDPDERERSCEALAAAIATTRLAQREDLVYSIEIFRALPTIDAAGRPERAATLPSLRSAGPSDLASSSAPPPSQAGAPGATAKSPASKRTGTVRSMEAVTEPTAPADEERGGTGV